MSTQKFQNDDISVVTRDDKVDINSIIPNIKRQTTR